MECEAGLQVMDADVDVVVCVLELVLWPLPLSSPFKSQIITMRQFSVLTPKSLGHNHATRGWRHEN